MDVWNMLYQGWPGLVRTLLVGLLAYASLVIFLRISGKRTLAKLNAFDLVVTVALGSTLSAILLQESVPLSQGIVALALLILMQFIVTSLSIRYPTFAEAVRSEPSLLVRNGTFCWDTMRRERITADETLSAIRAAGGLEVGGATSVILEADGKLSVCLQRPTAQKPDALSD